MPERVEGAGRGAATEGVSRRMCPSMPAMEMLAE